MKHYSNNLMDYKETPQWIERTLPKSAIVGGVPSVLLLKVPDEPFWVVASRLATDVIANPDSMLGGFMRSHSALLPLRYLSCN